MGNTETEEINRKNVILAALFLANKPLSMEELSIAAKCKLDDVDGYVAELSDDLRKAGFSLKVSVFEEAGKLAGTMVKLDVDEAYLPHVSHLSQQIVFSKKAQKILALIAKKKELLQSELKYYFKGDIYEAVQELVDLKYLQWEKYKNTKKLKPTKLFSEKFKMVE